MKYNHTIQRLCLCAIYLAALAAHCSTGIKRPPIASTTPINHYVPHSYLTKPSTALPKSLTQTSSGHHASMYKDWYAFPKKLEESKRKEEAKWDAFWAQSPAVWQTIYEKNDQEWIAFWEKKQEEFVLFWQTTANEWKKFLADAQHIHQALRTNLHDAASSSHFWNTYQQGWGIGNALNGVYQEAVNAFNQKLKEKEQAHRRFLHEQWSKQQAEWERTQRKAYETEDQSEVRKAYAVLGLRMNATLKEVKKAYHTLARKYHPDKTRNSDRHEPESTAKMQEINVAYKKIVAYLESKKEQDKNDSSDAETQPMPEQDPSDAA